MRRLSTAVDILADREHVWRLLTEFARWPEWGPTVTAVAGTARLVAPGVTGRVRTPVGVWLPFEITDYDEQVHWSWRVAGIPATGHTLAALEDGRTRVEFTVPWFAAPYVAVLRLGLRRLKRLAER